MERMVARRWLRLVGVLFAALVVALLFVSCKGGPTRGILSFMPDVIGDFGDFLKAWFFILLATIVLQFLLGLVGVSPWIVDVILFALVLWLRDYGFWMTLLLFLFSSFVGYLLQLLFTWRRRR